MFSFIEFAQADTATANMHASATLVPGCVFDSQSYSAHIGTIPAGTVGKGSVAVSITCTNDMAYSIQPQSDSVTYEGSEQVVVSLYKDAQATQRLTTASPLQASVTAGSNTTTHSIHIRANGPSGQVSMGEGPVLTSSQSFSVNFPILITY